MKTFVPRASCLLLSGLLLLPSAALAGEYPDLPRTHWAYFEMDRAVTLGLITGVGGGSLAPDDTLTWGQYLAMAARAVCPDRYRQALASGLTWDQAGYQAARESGLLLEDDFLPVDQTDLDAPILRREAAVLLERMLPDTEENRQDFWWFSGGSSSDDSSANHFSDWDSLTEDYQDAVTQLFRCGVIQGRDDGTFGGGESIRRADGSVLLLRTVQEIDRLLSGESKAVTLHIVNAEGTPLCADQTVTARIGGWSDDFVDTNPLWHYTCQSGSTQISSACDSYTLIYRPFTWTEAAEADFWDKVDRGEASAEDYWYQDFWLRCQGANDRKHQLLFGDSDRWRYSNQEEAAAHAATITVPVWKLSHGKKVSSTATFSINAAIADDVKAIFTEIYNDPEQFPIHDLGGYSWRGDSATGEHNCGTAIDINSNENYQVRDGQAMAGSFWKPGESPYSIGTGSSVVRIFADHGWSWGGTAWAYDSDPNSGYHDYMHFSYMGG